MEEEATTTKVMAEPSTRINSLKRFFLVCSGADLEILSQPECRTELNKYIGIGATIFSTALLATFSGGYALYTVFRSVPLAMLFGLIWGTIIFNLDRYIVSTIRKRVPPPDLSFRGDLWWRLTEFARFAPRLLLAIFISIVITRPIELRLFQSEIDKEMLNQTNVDLAALKEKIKSEFPDIERLTKENESLRKEVSDKEKYVQGLYELALAEGMGEQRGNTTGRVGKGPFYRERTAAYERSQAEFKDLKKANEDKIALNDVTIEELRKQQTAREEERRPKIEETGLVARLQTLSQISAASPPVEMASWFLILLFIMLETAPIIVKILSERGPYDDIYETSEYSVWAAQQKKTFEIENDLEIEKVLIEQLRAEMLMEKLQLNRNTMEKIRTFAAPKIFDAQVKISNSVVEDWETVVDRLSHRENSAQSARNGNAPASNQFANVGSLPQPEVDAEISANRMSAES